MAGAEHRTFSNRRLSSSWETAELVLLSATSARGSSTSPTPRRRGGAQATAPGEPGLVWISAALRPAQARWGAMQSQDGLADCPATRVAGDRALPRASQRPAARGPSPGPGIQSTVGLRHHRHPSLERTKGTPGHPHRLCRSNDSGLALCSPDHSGGLSGDVARSSVPSIWRGPSRRAGHRVPERQWARIHVASIPALCGGHGAGALSHPTTESGVERLSRGLLRELQTGLCLSGLSRDLRGGGPADPCLDSALQRAGATQCLTDALAGRVLYRMEGQDATTACPKINGQIVG